MSDEIKINQRPFLPIDPIIFLPDYSVEATQALVGGCYAVDITVHFSPGIIIGRQNPSVRVRVTDKVNDVPETVGELLLFLPATGGSTSARISYPRPADAPSRDWSNELIITVDPENQLAERNKDNNTVTVIENCIA